MKARELINQLTARLEALAKGNAMVGKPISMGDRHVLPLCEVAMGYGAGGGQGEGRNGEQPYQGSGVGAGGGARVSPVAMIVVDGATVRIESLV